MDWFRNSSINLPQIKQTKLEHAQPWYLLLRLLWFLLKGGGGVAGVFLQILRSFFRSILISLKWRDSFRNLSEDFCGNFFLKIQLELLHEVLYGIFPEVSQTIFRKTLHGLHQKFFSEFIQLFNQLFFEELMQRLV